MRSRAVQLKLFARSDEPGNTMPPSRDRPSTSPPFPRAVDAGTPSPGDLGGTIPPAAGGAAPARLPELLAFLTRELRATVQLTLTRNRRRLATYRRVGRTLRIRLVEHAVGLGPPSWAALVRWISRPDPRSRRALVDLLTDSRPPDAAAGVARPPRIRARGRTFDLDALLAAENARWFGGSFPGRITWGRAGHPLGRQRRRLLLGSYDDRTQLIRVHPCLDRPEVPEYMITTTIYHELLHWALARERGRRPPGGRHHTAEFRRREALHPDLGRSLAWLDAHLPRL